MGHDRLGRGRRAGRASDRELTFPDFPFELALLLPALLGFALVRPGGGRLALLSALGSLTLVGALIAAAEAGSMAARYLGLAAVLLGSLGAVVGFGLAARLDDEPEA
ncbi:hypothetical protein [Sphingobium ummariense]|uniref:Uncharacterized protein n=1 Tax=Sphingobium ummariense RL-3 TaxID=1346791 RepID=T0IS71_9SPHN|nr:hypothetical protein [Sphingobium ummariense]EQB31670.1 hypothetical protein M529_13660 [Sphingobium ummariense RL-3]